jgi:hypothetical protein
MIRLLLPVLVFVANPALAEKPLTGAEFEALTTGQIMDHSSALNGLYGAERYYPDRRVKWAFTGDDCKEGTWYEKGTMICFDYDDGQTSECWTYFRQGKGLRAIHSSDNLDAPFNPVDLIPTTRPLACLGPEVGV